MSQRFRKGRSSRTCSLNPPIGDYENFPPWNPSCNASDLTSSVDLSLWHCDDWKERSNEKSSFTNHNDNNNSVVLYGASTPINNGGLCSRPQTLGKTPLPKKKCLGIFYVHCNHTYRFTSHPKDRTPTLYALKGLLCPGLLALIQVSNTRWWFPIQVPNTISVA